MVVIGVSEAVERVIAELESVREQKGGWMALCPAHDDHNPSLSISVGEQGQVLLHCFAGCECENVVKAIGLTMRDLWPVHCVGGTRSVPGGRTKARSRMKSSIYETAEQAVAALVQRRGSPAAIWDYHDRDGRIAFKVVRWNTPDGKDYLPISFLAVEGGWVIQSYPPPRPLYKQRHLLGLPAASRVIVVEGEKAADVGIEMGFTTTTCAGGAHAVRQTDWAALAGMDVVLLPDNDAPGQKWVKNVLFELAKLSPVPTVRIVDLPDLPEGGDLVEFMSARGGEPNRVHSEIEEHITLADPILLNHGRRRSRWHPYPIDSLPKLVRDYVIAVAHMIGCDPAFCALPAITVLASAIGATRTLQVKRGFSVPAVLWSAIVAHSGTAKSPAAECVIRPLQDLERPHLHEYKRALKRYIQAMEEYRQESRRQKRNADSQSAGGPETPSPPKQIRFIIRDFTLEAVFALLEDNPRGLTVYVDELQAWIGSFDRYSGGRGGADRAQWLSIYDARAVTVDRKSVEHRRPISIPTAAVSIFGTVQPGIFSRLLNRDDRESGLLARLMLAAPPPRALRFSKNEIPPALERSWSSVIQRLLNLQMDVDSFGEACPQPVRLEAEARGIYSDFCNEQADRWDSTSNEEHLAVISKSQGTAARLGLILHLARWASGEQIDANWVDAESMKRAIVLARWHAEEAERISIILSEGPEERTTRAIVERIERKGGSMSASELVRNCRDFADVPSADAALQKIVDKGYGRWYQPPQEGRGRPRARRLILAEGNTGDQAVGLNPSQVDSNEIADDNPKNRNISFVVDHASVQQAQMRSSLSSESEYAPPHDSILPTEDPTQTLRQSVGVR